MDELIVFIPSWENLQTADLFQQAKQLQCTLKAYRLKNGKSYWKIIGPSNNLEKIQQLLTATGQKPGHLFANK